MSNTDLVAFLRARFDEDEQTARAAAARPSGVSGERWRVSGTHSDDGGTYWSVTTVSSDDRVGVIELIGSGMSGGGAHTEEVAQHVVHHAPARVLAEVDAKREVLRLASAAHDYYETFMSGFAAEMEKALRLFAVAYADHPDYKNTWRP
ncbi:DUF6221 family protein [Streptomyces sp. NPDC091287]|uniref:DUF6221 family protein n=1 Tax=Streptomyces sp. NPDC091287 TaxID=3365988 RepID=UPI00380F957F